jgi:hypothetical protein
MRIAAAVAGILSTIVIGIACEPPAGTFTPASFRQTNSGYDVRYHDSAAQAVLSPDWRLDNFYKSQSGELTPKTGGDYEVSFDFDLDGDGKPDKTQTLPAFDLRFEHLRTAGVIWLRSIPVAPYVADKELRVLMQDYVDSVAGAGYEIAVIDHKMTMVSKRYAAQIVEQHAATVAGHEALAAVIDVANVDQLQMSASARKRRVELLLVRAKLQHVIPAGIQGGQDFSFPVFLLAGYANLPEYFDQSRAEFHEFVGQIALGGSVGFSERSDSKDGQGADAGTGRSNPDGSVGPAEPSAHSENR